MDWIIRDGFITNPDGDGIRIEGATGNLLIANMTIQGAKGNGISIIGSGSVGPGPLRLVDILDELESRVPELPFSDRETARIVLNQIKEDQSTINVKRCFRFLYDLAVQVSGSTIANMLYPLI